MLFDFTAILEISFCTIAKNEATNVVRLVGSPNDIDVPSFRKNVDGLTVESSFLYPPVNQQQRKWTITETGDFLIGTIFPGNKWKMNWNHFPIETSTVPSSY